MAIGYPGRPSYEELGGTREDRYPVTHPRVQIGMGTWNAVQWQVAGGGKVGALVSLTITSAGVRESGGEAWNQADETSNRVGLTHSATGVYVIAAQAASYPDWSGVAQPVIFLGAIATPRSSSDRRATYTRDSATQITVRIRDGSGTLVDCDFTVDIK